MSHCKESFCAFVGRRAFEDDAGWSWDVWQAAYNAALLHAEERFKRLDSIPMTGSEAAKDIKRLRHVPQSEAT